MPALGLVLAIAVALPLSLPAIGGDHGTAAMDQADDAPGPHLGTPPVRVTLAIAAWLFVALVVLSMASPVGIPATRHSRLRAPPRRLGI
jgi:hypothetical protein